MDTNDMRGGVKKVKAWVFLDSRGEVYDVNMVVGKSLRDFYNNSKAGYRVLPCEVTYQLPTIEK